MGVRPELPVTISHGKHQEKHQRPTVYLRPLKYNFFQKNLKCLKAFFYCFVQKTLHLLCKKQLKYLQNCQFHTVLLLELLKMANFFKNLNLRKFSFVSFSNISGTPQDISKSSEFVAF